MQNKQPADATQATTPAEQHNPGNPPRRSKQEENPMPANAAGVPNKTPQPRKTNTTETRVLPETAWANEPVADGIPPEGTSVITISRQFGSGGSEIAHLVAQWARIKYVDHAIIAEVAKRMGIDTQSAAEQDEHTRGMAGHIIEAMQSSNPFALPYSLTATPAQYQSKELAHLQLTQNFILETASAGDAIIVGRGSQFLLHNNPRTLHIHIFAPMPYRIEKIMKEHRLSHNAAQQLIEQRDYEQNSYLRRYYGSDGNEPSLYHLLINTGLFSYENAADFICQALPAIKKIH